MKYPVTPDGRYFVVKGKLWRATNPNLSEAERNSYVKNLMDARRAVKQAKSDDDEAGLKAAREQVNQAKIALASAVRYGGVITKKTLTGIWPKTRPINHGTTA